MSITVTEFINQVKAIAAEGPKYRLGGYGRDGTCDCIGLTIGAIRRAGGAWPGTHGSNYAARNELVKLERNSADNLFVGKQVLKAREKGDSRWKLPSRYWNGTDQRDYYHAGVITSVNPLEITHSTGTGLPSSIKRDTALGAWTFGGKLRRVEYDALEEQPGGLVVGDGVPVSSGSGGSVELPGLPVTTAIIHTQNGGPLNIRAKPTKTCGLYWKLPCGTQVTVLETDTGSPGWWKVRGGGITGYCWNTYLAVG